MGQKTSERFIAIDAHKHYVVLGGLNARMVVLSLRRISVHRFPEWAEKHLKSTDAVVIEATTNTWTLYNTAAPLVAKALVVNAYQVKLIAAARVKTDKHDVWALARLLVAGASSPRSGSRPGDAGVPNYRRVLVKRWSSRANRGPKGLKSARLFG